MKIVVAEDEPLMRERLLAQLGKLMPEARLVSVVENGNDAWDACLEHEPDLVFLDIRMPGLTGLEVARRLAGSAQVVFITAYDDYAIEAFEAGGGRLFIKTCGRSAIAKDLAACAK